MHLCHHGYRSLSYEKASFVLFRANTNHVNTSSVVGSYERLVMTLGLRDVAKARILCPLTQFVESCVFPSFPI